VPSSEEPVEPVLVATLSTTIVIDTTESLYEEYGGDIQFISDLQTFINSTSIEVTSSTEDLEKETLSITYVVSIYDTDSFDLESLKAIQSSAYLAY
jgi:hypothetical protein